MKGRRFAVILAFIAVTLVSGFTATLGSNRATVKLARTSTSTSLDVHLHIPIWKRPRLISNDAPTILKMTQAERGIAYERRDLFVSSPFKQVFNCWLRKQTTWISVLKSIILPSIISFILVNVFNVHPAMALAANTAVNKGKNGQKLASDAGVGYATTQVPVWYRRFRKLLFKPIDNNLPMDQRYDVSNSVSARLIVFLFIASMIYGTVAAQISEKLAEWRLVKEVQREKQYRELMVYDAIKLIRQKLAEPKLKASVRDDLSKQLRELDPKGEIVAHLDGKGPKPNLSEFIEMMTNNAANKNKKKTGTGARRKKPANKPSPASPSPAATSKPTTPPALKSASRDDDDEEQDKDDKEDFEFDERQMRMDEERARREAISLASSKNNNRNNGNNDGNNKGIEKGSEKDVNRLMNDLRDSMNEEFSGAELSRLTNNLKNRLMSLDRGKRAATMSKIEQKLEDSDYWQKYLEKL